MEAIEKSGIDELYNKLKSKEMQHLMKIHSEIRKALHLFFTKKMFYEISPVIVAPITDPLNHPVYKASVDYYGFPYGLTQSMIFHKQIALLSYDKVFIFSPNVRLEPVERGSTGRHLAEFTQVDIEMKDVTREHVMDLAEDMFIYTTEEVSETCKEDLEYFGRKLQIPGKPFRRYSYIDEKNRYGNDFDMILSKKEKNPFWIVDIPLMEREFYDREYENKEGILVDMDMYYPEGFGEAISGGEREYEYDKILTRISKKGQTEEQFKYYLEFAKKGLPRTAGFGIGVERLTRYITGFDRIEEVVPFPRIINKFSF